MFVSNRRSRVALVAVALAGVVLGGCGAASDPSADGSSGNSEGPTVVVTTGILGDMVANVVGDLAEVEVLMPPGTDPHDFEPSAQQVAQMEDAALVVANGLGLEAGLTETLDAVAADGGTVLSLGEQLSPIPFAGDTDSPDPHFWMDPDRMASSARLVAEELAAATDLPEDELLANATAYGEEIALADEAIQEALFSVPEQRRTLVTNHEAFGYFAERYGYEIVGTVIPGGSTQAEPSAGELADLAAAIGAAGVPAIFSDTSSSDAFASTLADEVGSDVEVVALYSESLGEPGSGADTYIGLITTNADRIAAALGGAG